MTSSAVPALVPDDKDWTWVLDRPCPECGYDATRVPTSGLGAALREDAPFWTDVLGGDAARLTTRPSATSWSVTEYACHIRDVHELFVERVAAMLAAGPGGARFANWDQDATAVEKEYHRAEPARVLTELVAAAESAAAAYDAVPDEAWQRIGLRSNGSRFTVATLGAYHLHDVVHHRWDVRRILGG